MALPIDVDGPENLVNLLRLAVISEFPETPLPITVQVLVQDRLAKAALAYRRLLKLTLRKDQHHLIDQLDEVLGLPKPRRTPA